MCSTRDVKSRFFSAAAAGDAGWLALSLSLAYMLARRDDEEKKEAKMRASRLIGLSAALRVPPRRLFLAFEL